MKSDKSLIRLAALALGLACCLPCFAETPEQIEQRLDDLRRMDAEAARRRQETLEFQAQRKREEYARRWKRYGDEEIDVLKWRQQKDGTWVTEVKNVSAQVHINSHLPVQDRAVVRFGDTVVKIAQRYGLTLQELLRLNPGLENARLVVGSQVRVARSTPIGVSWPQLPGLEKSKLSDRPPARFDSSFETLISEIGVQHRLVRCSSKNSPLLLGVVQVPGQSGSAIFKNGGSSISAAVGERIGSSGWRLQSASGDSAVIERHGISRRVTIGGCSQDLESAQALIGVTCTTLMVNRKTPYKAWGTWTRPEKGSTDEQLIIDRCTTNREGS